jgi:hypothetical protein
MSTSRQFLVPINYDVEKQVYPHDDIVRKRQYLIDELKSKQQYHQNYVNTFSDQTNFETTVYADKLRQRIKY